MELILAIFILIIVFIMFVREKTIDKNDKVVIDKMQSDIDKFKSHAVDFELEQEIKRLVSDESSYDYVCNQLSSFITEVPELSHIVNLHLSCFSNNNASAKKSILINRDIATTILLANKGKITTHDAINGCISIFEDISYSDGIERKVLQKETLVRVYRWFENKLRANGLYDATILYLPNNLVFRFKFSQYVINTDETERLW